MAVFEVIGDREVSGIGGIGPYTFTVTSDHTTPGIDQTVVLQRMKTGALFEFCCESAAVLASAGPEHEERLRNYARDIGLLFQITDDLLDFESDAGTLGKAVLADVVEGKPSLPLAIALKRLPPLRGELEQLLAANADDDSLPGRVRAFATRLGRTGALGAARRAAEKERDAALAALEILPESPTRDLLAQVAHLLLSRTH